MFNSLDDIEIINPEKDIGEGAYSKVYQAKLKKTGELCALKKVDISRLAKQDCNNLRNEIETHKLLDHPFIVRFIDCIQIDAIVYILLEYASNGSLFGYINPQRGIPETSALRFLYQTALAVKYLHDMKIIHRDIKPENILLDDGMNVKLCDFGWSASLNDNDARTTVCGTLEYMSPEIVHEKAHNNKVDMWCLGVLLFEMVNGKAPFVAKSLIDLKTEVVKEKIVFRPHVSEEIKELTLQLMEFDADKRMDVESLLSHPTVLKHYESFFQPIAKEDYEVLIQNYYDYKYPKAVVAATPPPKLQRFLDIRVQQGEQSKLIPIPVPDSIEIIEQSVLNINNFVGEERRKHLARHSESAVLKLKQHTSEHEAYLVSMCAQSTFMSSSIIRNAIAGRFAFHPSGKIILLERKIAWQKDFYKTEAQLAVTGQVVFVVYFDPLYSQFIIESIPYENEPNVVRKLLRKDFHGRKRQELCEITNLPDIEFCHVTGTRAGCWTLISATLVADLSL